MSRRLIMRNQETASQQRKATTAPAIRRCAWRTAGAVRRRGQRALRSPTQQRYWHVLHSPCLEPPEQETMPASEETDASASGSAERVAVALRRRAEGRRAGGAQAPGRQPLPGHLPGSVLTAEDRRPRTHRAPTGDRRRQTAVTARREGWTVDGISFTVRPWRSLQPLDRKRAAGSDRGKASCRVVWASRPSKQPSYHCGPCLVMRRARRLLPSRAPASCGDDSTGHRWRGRGPHCRRRRRRRRPRRRSRGLARCPRSTAPWRAKQPEIASTALLPLSSLI